MTARDELLAVLRRSGYSQQRAADLIAQYDTETVGETARDGLDGAT